MTEKELRQMVKYWENLYLVVQTIEDHPEHVDLLFKIGLDESEPEHWRAIWMIDKIHEKHPEMVIKHLPEMISFVYTTRNSGKKRHLLKLISLHYIEESDLAQLLNFCLNLFTNPAEPVAIRVHAMQILFNIAEKEPEFSGELIDLIENEIEFHGSGGIKSRGRKLLKKLYQQKKSVQ